MRAFRISNWKEGATWVDVPKPEPGPGEILIRIGGAGACHSDLHIMHEFSPETMPLVEKWPIPMTLGHENAGWIEGGDTGSLEIGAPVVLSFAPGCGQCAACRQGATNYCEHPEGLLAPGIGRDGGFAEYMLAPTRSAIPLHKLEPWQAAPLTDAGLTSYHAIKRCLPLLTPDATAVVIGVGGLGHMAVKLLRVLTGASIIAVDRDNKALELAREMGADITLSSDESATSEIRKATGGLGAMVIFDFVGIDATLEMAAGAVRTRGQIVVVGIGGGTLPFSYGGLPLGVSVVSTYGGSILELAEVVALAESGRIESHITQFPLDQVEQVYEKMKNNEIRGRAVLVP